MKHRPYIAFVFFLVLAGTGFSQPQLFRQNGKWGAKENEAAVIPAKYDTIFNFDATGKVCMACLKSTGASANKFIKVFTISYTCNYLDKAGKRLSVKVPGNDTCTVFSHNKLSVKQYTANSPYFVVNVKNKKHLVDKQFNQLTFKGYYDISLCPEPGFLVVQSNETGSVLTGLINTMEEEVIPYQYTDIKFNTVDSLIIACSAGVNVGSDDDIYNYAGKKVGAYHRHVDMVTKNFVIHKLFEPKEVYIIYNIATKEEKNLNAEEVKPLSSDELLIRIKNDWYSYDMITNQKKPTKQS